MLPSTWFGRLAVFVLVLVGLRIFFRWNISIIGSLAVTLLVYVILEVMGSSRSKNQRTTEPEHEEA